VDVAELLADLFGRVPEVVHEAVDGLEPEQLLEQPGGDANPIAWLVWHLARVEDAQIAELVGEDQVWMSDDWPARFGLTADPGNHGYGHTPQQVRAVRPESTAALLDYLAAVHTRTEAMLSTLTPDDLDRVVDRNWDPPVTMGVRLISVADDCIQHAGQAAYVRGLLAAR
jgi:hypothetical protein